MTDQRLTSELPGTAIARSGEPSYHVGRRTSEIVARFASRTDVDVTQGRVRAYPGLAGSAPSTLAFYDVATKTLRGKHILDVGSGSGGGTRILSEHYAHVTGVE